MLVGGKTFLLCQELDRLSMHITGLCETRWKKDGNFYCGDHRIYWSGSEKGGECGVAIVLDKKTC